MSVRKAGKYVTFCFALAVAAAASARAEILPARTLTVADGLARDAVRRVRQDSRGFVWFCTEEGLSRFDGDRIVNFTAADGLPNRVVNDVLETRDGAVLIATDGGLAVLDPYGTRGSESDPMFVAIAPPSARARAVKVLFQDSGGRVWAGTSDGLFEVVVSAGVRALAGVALGAPLSSSGGAVSQPEPNTLPVTSIIESRSGELWVGTFGGGLFRLSPGGGVTRATSSDGLPDNKVTDLLETRDGRVWTSFRSDESGGVCVLDARENSIGVAKCFTEANGLGSNWIRDMTQTGDGRMWLATVNGLCAFDDASGKSVCRMFAAENGICDDVISLFEDRDGNLWTGSGCGVSRISRFGFTAFTIADGLAGKEVGSVFEDNSGGLIVAPFPRAERTLSRFDGGGFKSVKVNLPPDVTYHGWGWQQTVWQDSRGAWWIPTGQGLFRTPDETPFERLSSVTLERVATGAENTEIFRLFEDSRGDVWIATHGVSGELLLWERRTNTWRNVSKDAGFDTPRVGTAFAEDAFGNVWIGATSDHDQSALLRYRDGVFRVFSQLDGAPSGWIQDIFVDSGNRLWLATSDHGVWRLEHPDAEKLEFAKFGAKNGLSSDSAASLTEDGFGRIYIGNWRGIDRLTPETGIVDSFAVGDGLPGSLVSASFRDRAGTLWFATENGLARLEPRPARERIPPTTVVTALSVGGVPRKVSVLGDASVPRLEIASDQRQLSVEYVGLGASLGEKIGYEYRLDGGEWKPTSDKTLNFANLGAGEFRLEIRARTADRLVGAPATVAFGVAAPMWQRPWFLAATAAAIALLIYLIYRARLRRLIELEKVRMRIATDLHDDIGANLTRISLLSEVARQGAANGNGALLSSIADIARESVGSMNDIVWAIAPEHDGLLDLTRRMRRHAEEVFAARDVELEFNAPASPEITLSLGARRDVLLIFKEAVSNAARHSGCRHVKVDFGIDKSILTLRVEDDSKGFDPDAASDGHGLRSMKRRASEIGGQFVVGPGADGGSIVRLDVKLTTALRG